MRIGLLTGEFPPMQGGVGDFTRELALALAALGEDVQVITRPLGAAGPPAAYGLHPCSRAWAWPALLQVRALARRLRLDILNIQYQAAAYDLAAPIHFLPAVAGVKTVVTFHDLRIPYLFPKAGPLRPLAVTRLARSAAGAIATDPADAAELRRRGVRRVAQIPIGSNIAPVPPAGYDRAAWRAQNGIGPQMCLVGYFGFLNASKGGDTLVRALAQLAAQNLPVKLALIGGRTGASDTTNAAFSAQVEAEIRQADLTDRVIRTGFIEPAQVSAWLLACDLLTLPYRDGVSFRRGTLMAALAHGCPIISTQPPVAWPELQAGENMCLVPPAAPEALAAAVQMLWRAPELRARLGRGAQALAELFRWETIAARTRAFYQTLLDRPTS